MDEPESSLEDLLPLAEHIDEAALDELVYDAVHQGASHAYNFGEGGQGSDHADYESVHTLADNLASDINNGGHSAQISYLMEQYGVAETQAILTRAR